MSVLHILQPLHYWEHSVDGVSRSFHKCVRTDGCNIIQPTCDVVPSIHIPIPFILQTQLLMSDTGACASVASFLVDLIADIEAQHKAFLFHDSFYNHHLSHTTNAPLCVGDFWIPMNSPIPNNNGPCLRWRHKRISCRWPRQSSTRYVTYLVRQMTCRRTPSYI